ncbi:MAG: ABC transporter permease subunit [Burkholderiales bacterium]
MNIYVMDIRRSLKPLIIWTVSTAAVFALVISLYPVMLNSDFVELLDAKLKLLPRELLDMFHMSGEDIRELPSYFAWVFQFVLMAACLNGAITGINALAREQSEGTIEFLSSKPVRRGSIAAAKLAAACTEYAIYFVTVGIAGALACVFVKPAELDGVYMLAQVAAVLLGGFIAGLVYLFLGLLVSVFLQRARTAGTLAVGIFFLTYILGLLPALEVLGFLKWVSPINYFTPSQVVMAGSIDWGNALICFGVMAAFATVAFAVYRRKDFLV